MTGVEFAGWTLVHGHGWTRDDADGTAWRIAHDIARGGATLTMRYRDHLLVSHHRDPMAAVAHHRDMVAMLSARTLAAYERAIAAQHDAHPQLCMTPVDGQEAMF